MKRTLLLLAATLLALVVFSGVALAATVTCQAEVNCFGTKRADTLNGSEGRDLMHGKGRGDTLNGFGGINYLYGEGGADKLFGGPNVDTLAGGPGNDALSGGEDTDYYDVYSGWGKDSITDSATSQNFVHFVGLVNEDLTIKLISGDGPEVKNAGATSTINWEGNVIGHVTSGAGDDQITGNSASNDIDASSGADTVSSGGGDDTIHVDDGAPDDVVDCGETLFNNSDNDTVYYDPGDDVTNCEVHNP